MLAITATGSGKSGYIYMLMILLQEFSRDPSLNPSDRRFPSNPAIVVISPTIALQDLHWFTPLAGDVTRRTCSLNHSQTHDQIV